MSNNVFEKKIGGVGRGLIIGIADYQFINQLPPVAINDANDVFLTLTDKSHCGYSSSNVTKLLNDEATLENIRSSLGKIASESEEDDSVFIYFSGHGGTFNKTSSYSALLPVDFSLADEEKTCFSEEEFSSFLKKIKAKKILVVLDACHSGGTVNFKSIEESFDYNFATKSADLLSKGNGRVILASSRDNEVSLILPGDNNSVFTKHFLNALKGNCKTKGDGTIRVLEVVSHVLDNVNIDVTYRTSSRYEQHPQLKAHDLEDNFSIALDKGGTTKSGNTDTNKQPKKSNDSSTWSELESISAELYLKGPEEQNIWERSGGDLSRLSLNGNGRTQWFLALKVLKQGGGGAEINFASLVDVMLVDYPNNPRLYKLKIAME